MRAAKSTCGVGRPALPPARRECLRQKRSSIEPRRRKVFVTVGHLFGVANEKNGRGGLRLRGVGRLGVNTDPADPYAPKKYAVKTDFGSLRRPCERRATALSRPYRFRIPDHTTPLWITIAGRGRWGQFVAHDGSGARYGSIIWHPTEPGRCTGSRAQPQSEV
jgi:hypothetical protein